MIFCQFPNFCETQAGAYKQTSLKSLILQLFQSCGSILFFCQQISILIPHFTIPDNGIYLLMQSFSGFLQIRTWIFEILDYIIYRVQIQIAHVSEISLLLGNKVLNFFFIFKYNNFPCCIQRSQKAVSLGNRPRISFTAIPRKSEFKLKPTR